ncbi:outer membrane protein transport protein [uncultured Bacteroides sp.]|uniref:OmpP1/FadL family transporter n=1 Tax=uncultured Bacteroides sp. TaxID=162156 RepID=UPI00280AE7E4|nr:TonB-dependent receptor [uncultured Bacteroides sp.]
MKKIIAVACALCFVAGVSAQTIYDAAKLAERDLNGTARFVGMGGAMGALGGDISTMGTNPAGIGIYRSNDIMTSFSYSAYGTESKYLGQTFNNDKNQWSFDNIGFVFASKIGNQTALRYVNFGFNYKRTKSFYKNMTMGGLMGVVDDKIFVSQVNQMGQQATDAVWYDKDNYDFNGADAYSNNRLGWLGIMGYQGYLTNSVLDKGYDRYDPVVPDEAEAYFNSNERGGISQYDFNVALNVNDRVYLGLTIGAYDVNYKKTTLYDEDYGNGEGYELASFNRIKGSGVDVKFGAIFRPFESSPFRIGFAIHTPTFYNLTYENGASMTSDVYLKEVQDGNKPFYVRDDKPGKDAVTTRESFDANGGRRIEQDFRLSTPWRFNASLGYTVGTSLALGAEYEYEDYSSMKFKYPEGDEMVDQNTTIKEFMKGVHTFRIGAEYKVIPEFAFRLGYNYSTTAFKENDAYKWIPVNSTLTDTDFANSQSHSNYTIGIGYRGKAFYADLAYQYSMYKEKFYPFYNDLETSPGVWEIVTPQATKVTNTRSQVLLTLGMRF